MLSRKCKYATSCPVFNGTLKEQDKPSFMYRNVFCHSEKGGWNTCKRFHIYELGNDPPQDLLPGNRESIEHILSNNK